LNKVANLCAVVTRKCWARVLKQRSKIATPLNRVLIETPVGLERQA
jgi:hypothetical protein